MFIITRPAEDARRFINAAKTAGASVVSMPVMDIHFIDGAAIPDKPWQAVAITSANGARAIARRADAPALARARAVTVGPASTRAALDAGFLHVLQAPGDVSALIRTVKTQLHPRAGPILYASGAITRGALERRLAEAGFEVHRAVLYEARPAQRLGEEARAALMSEKPGTVALYSPRSARIWGELVRKERLADQAGRWRHACLSRNVAHALREALPEARHVVVAPHPREEDMLRMLGLPAD